MKLLTYCSLSNLSEIPPVALTLSTISLLHWIISTAKAVKAHKLQHSFVANNTSRHSYFNRIPHLWNALPVINLNPSINIIKKTTKDILI